MELTIKQAAAQLGKAESTIRAWLRQGKLDGQKVGRTWQIPAASLAALRANPPARKASQTSRAKASKLVRQIAAQVVAELKPILLAAMQPVQPQTQAQPQAIPSPEPSQAQASETAQLTEQIATLQSQVQALAKQLGQMQTAQPEPKAKGQSQPPEPEANPQNQNQHTAGKRQPPDEGKAEKWVRENLTRWLDEPCRLRKATGRTWRELGENKGEKIEVNSKLSPPRAYLHAIESWANGDVWMKIKAKIALEITKSERHLEAISG